MPIVKRLLENQGQIELTADDGPSIVPTTRIIIIRLGRSRSRSRARTGLQGRIGVRCWECAA